MIPGGEELTIYEEPLIGFASAEETKRVVDSDICAKRPRVPSTLGLFASIAIVFASLSLRSAGIIFLLERLKSSEQKA